MKMSHDHEVQRLDAFAHQAEVGFGLQRGSFRL